MTRTTSVKKNLNNGLAVFGYELKKCRTPLIIFAIIAGFFTTVILSLTLVTANQTNAYSAYTSSLFWDNTNAFHEAIAAFERGASLMVFLMTCVYTIIYTLRVFSYLHNKRKADWINPMPIQSGVLLISKALAAFVASVVPALFFIGIICIITACCGVAVNPEILSLFVQIPLGSIACISFYGLLAVCCGSSANTVLTFLAICFCYPASMFFIKGMLDSFFYGLPTDIRGEHFILKALNPLAAYDGVNAIYWILFTLGCFALSVFLLRHRKAERAQTSFAFRLPCYVVEIMITFIAGMLLGIIFASTNMFRAPFGGFVFGFLLGGATAFVIAHVILFRGFAKILKSLICFGAVSVAAIAFTAICCFLSDGYSNYMPEKENIASAGYIHFDSDGFLAPQIGDITGMIKDSAEDFSDEKYIDEIYSAHETVMRGVQRRSMATKFRSIFTIALESKMRDVAGYPANSHSFAYKLKDGKTITRFYDTDYLTYSPIDSIYGNESYSWEYYNYSGADKITQTPIYAQKYSLVARLSVNELESVVVQAHSTAFSIKNTDGKQDMDKLFKAFQSDFLKCGGVLDDGYYGSALRIRLNVSGSYQSQNGTALSILTAGDNLSAWRSWLGGNYYRVPSTYTETIKVLQEIGVIDDQQYPNYQSPYRDKNSDIYGYDDYYDFTEDDEDVSYAAGETVLLLTGTFDAPWECIVRQESGMENIYDENDNLLMFESNTIDNIIGTGSNYEENNPYASHFKLQEVLTSEKDEHSYCVSGTAKVLADNKEQTLRFIQFGISDDNQLFFLTEKATDDDFAKIKKTCGAFEADYEAMFGSESA